MNDRQEYLDRIRELKLDLKGELQGGKFLKEAESFMLREATTMLERVEEYLNGYLQVDKERGN